MTKKEKKDLLDIRKAYASLCTDYAKEKMKKEVNLLVECIDLCDWDEAGKITQSLMFMFIHNQSIQILLEANENGLFDEKRDVEENIGYG